MGLHHVFEIVSRLWDCVTSVRKYHIFTIVSRTDVIFYFSHRRGAQFKKLIKQKLMGAPKNLVVDTFPDPIDHFGFCRLCGVAGGERVPLAPLDWYFIIKPLLLSIKVIT